MTVAATRERLEATLRYLKRRADEGLSAPTNREIAIAALKPLGLGRQLYQPWDRVMGIHSKKPEHGAVMIAALEALGHIAVERGRNWRRIWILDTGQCLEPSRLKFC